MKKLILTFAILLAAVAQAEFMMWSVTDQQIAAAGLAGQVSYTRVGYVVDGGEGGVQPAWNGVTLEAYDMSGNSTGGSDIGYVEDAEFQVNLTGLTTGSYSFYIELLNSSHQVIGRSGDESTHTYATYADLQSSGCVSTGDIGTVPTANVWQGGGSFTACPEPSSMALLALGAGLVGLRRKMKKMKKARRTDA